QAARCPDEVAVACGDRSLTYAELNGRANRLAAMLIERGVVPDSLVGLSIERSIEMVVGLLAILKSGGAYVPLDPPLPSGRLAFIVADTGIRLVVTRPMLAGRLPVGVTWVDVEGGGAEIALPDVGGSSLAYCLFTSGSTGTPKGVLVEHRHLATYAHDV